MESVIWVFLVHMFGYKLMFPSEQWAALEFHRSYLKGKKVEQRNMNMSIQTNANVFTCMHNFIQAKANSTTNKNHEVWLNILNERLIYLSTSSVYQRARWKLCLKLQRSILQRLDYFFRAAYVIYEFVRWYFCHQMFYARNWLSCHNKCQVYISTESASVRLSSSIRIAELFRHQKIKCHSIKQDWYFPIWNSLWNYWKH